MATDNTTERDDLRSQLDAAFEQHATDETGGEPADPPPAEQVEQQHEATPAEAAQADEARARDERGRFAAKGPAQAATAAQAPAQAAGVAEGAAPPAQAATEPKAPAAWRPEVREKWAGVDPAVKGEIARRETEHQRLMQQGSDHRNFVDAFQRIVAPYELFIRQENATPLQAVQNLMQTAATLRVGSPVDKAQLVGNIVLQHGIDLKQLDTYLTQRLGGEAGVQAYQQSPAQQFRDPRFDAFLAQQAQYQRQNEQREQQEIETTLTTFAQSHEFYADVAGLMADIVDARAKRGEAPDLEKVYDLACKMHDGVSTILTQRAATAKSAATSQAVLRAKRAAASVKGESSLGEGSMVPKDDTVRAALEAAFDAHATR